MFFLKFINSILLLLWLVASLYFAVAGYLSMQWDIDEKRIATMKPDGDSITIDNVTYRNVREYKLTKTQINLIKLFPHQRDLPETLSMLMTALSFGALGSITLLFHQMAFGSDFTIETIKVYSIPILGMLSGLFILGLTYLIPTLLISDGETVRPEVLVFSSLFAGLFCRQFYEWLNGCFDRIFPTEKKEP